MTDDVRPARCPSCGHRVEDRPASCPECGLTFLSVCSCGSTWHLLHPRCPSCGQEHRIRRKPDRRRRIARRTAIVSFGVVFVILVVLSVYFAVSQSPRRRKYHAYQDGLVAYEHGSYSEASILFRQYLEIEPDSPEARYMLGLSLLRTGEADAAARELVRATEIDDGFHLADVALSEYYRRRGDVRAALARARRATAKPPVSTDAWYALGLALVEAGDADGAIEALKRVVAADPDRVPAQLSLGDLYLTRKYLGLDELGEKLADERYRRAEQTAHKLLDADRTNVEARLWLAKARAGRGYLSDAIAEIEKVVAEEPDEPEHRLLLARFCGALGDFEREDRVLADALDRTPTPALAILRSRILAGELHDADEARRVLLTAIERSPDHSGLRVALAAHERDRERFDECRRVLDEAIAKLGDRADLLEARGDLGLVTGDEAAAEEGFRAAIAADPGAVGARKKLVKLLLPRVVAAISAGETNPPGRKELEASLDFFLDRKTGLNPADPDARDAMARLAVALGDYDRATELLGGTDDSAAMPKSWAGLRLRGLALLNRDAPRYAQASDALYAALLHRDCPKGPEDFELAWTAAWRTGHHAREAEIAEMAVKKWPQDADWLLRLAESRFRDGNPDAALAACRDARVFLPGPEAARSWLLEARIEQATGDNLAARHALEQAVALRKDAETRGALYAFFAAIGDEERAEKGFLALIDEDPEDPRGRLLYGDYLLKHERTDEALEQYERAREADPKSREAIYRVAELKMAAAASDEGKLSAAQEAVASLASDDPYLDYFAGKLHLLRGENDRATAVLERYVRRNRNDAAGLYYLGVAHRRTGDLKRAREDFVAASTLDPALVEAQLQLAALYFLEGIRARGREEWDTAREAFQRVTSLDPREPASRGLLAESLAVLGRVPEAAAQAEKALALRPDDVAALFLTGILAARGGDLDTAGARFARLVALRPDNYRSHLYLGMVRTEQGRFDEAREQLLGAMRLEPDDPDVLRAVVLTEVAAGKPADALALLASERERSPRRPDVPRLLGEVHRSLSRWDDAIGAWRAAWELDPTDSASLCLAAAALADRGRTEEALALLAEGEQGRGPRAPVLTLKGAMLLRGGDAAGAENAFREALVADTSFAPALRALGLLLCRTDRAAEGESVLERAVANGLDDAAVWFRLARLSAARGEKEKAVERYRAVLRLAPEEAPALNNLALLLSTAEPTRAEAIELAARAREIAGGDPRYADTYGLVLFRADRFDEATEVLLPAAKALADDAEVQCHAGMAAFKAYRWEVAKPLLDRAFELADDFEGADAAKAALQRMR